MNIIVLVLTIWSGTPDANGVLTIEETVLLDSGYSDLAACKESLKGAQWFTRSKTEDKLGRIVCEERTF